MFLLFSWISYKRNQAKSKVEDSGSPRDLNFFGSFPIRTIIQVYCFLHGLFKTKNTFDVSEKIDLLKYPRWCNSTVRNIVSDVSTVWILQHPCTVRMYVCTKELRVLYFKIGYWNFLHSLQHTNPGTFWFFRLFVLCDMNMLFYKSCCLLVS